MLFSVLLIIFCFFNLFPPSLLAIDDFTISEDIEYLVSLSGQATVTHQITFTNNLSQIFPTEYKIEILGLSLSDLSASDDEGNILTDFSSKDGISTIKVKFNKANVGKNQNTTIKLIYRIADLAKNKGKTWEIVLPKTFNKSSTKSQISLKTPSEFGSLSFASVSAKFEDGLTHNITTFQNNSSSEILIIFGNYQLFDFSLNYHLKNPGLNIVTSEIALIPDTYSQSVFYKSISPSPKGINIDSDGNWLAQYEINPQEELDIIVTGQVKTGLRLPESSKNLENYLEPQKFWPLSDPQIQSLLDKVTTPRSIYEYVISTLHYDYNRINNSSRLGAIEALNNPQNALCTEFTDLFVTLARAKGIPAREIQGFAYSSDQKIKPLNLNNDILHAWPEYYDIGQNSWKAIDPTWGKTTGGIDYFNNLDLNHITFVTHGLNSEYPLPAGSYQKDENTKSVFIDFATQDLKYEQTFPRVYFQKNKLILQNQSPNSQKNITISSEKLSFSQELDTILPYSSLEINLPKMSFFKSLSSKNQKITFILTNSEGQNSTQSLNYPLHFLNLGLLIILSLIILSISGIIITNITHEKTS
jgi:transglutaminase-like putative cysteine protease